MFLLSGKFSRYCQCWFTFYILRISSYFFLTSSNIFYNIFVSWHATILQRRGSVYFCTVSEYSKRNCRSCRLQNVAFRPLLWDLCFCIIHYFLYLSNVIKQVGFFGKITLRVFRTHDVLNVSLCATFLWAWQFLSFMPNFSKWLTLRLIFPENNFCRLLTNLRKFVCKFCAVFQSAKAYRHEIFLRKLLWSSFNL